MSGLLRLAPGASARPVTILAARPASIPSTIPPTVVDARVDLDEPAFTARQHCAGRASYFARVKQIAALLLDFPAFHYQVFVHRNRPQILDLKLGCNRPNVAEAPYLAHHFVKKGGNDAAVNESRAALVLRAYSKLPANASRVVVFLELQVHAAGVRAAASKAGVGRVDRKRCACVRHRH